MAVNVNAQCLNIFDPPAIDESISSYEYLDLKESNVNVTNSKTFEFSHKNLDCWIHPHNSFLYIKAKVKKSDDSNLGATDTVAPVNNACHIFQRAQYFIEEKEVEEVSNVGLATTIKNLIDFSEDFSKSGATNSFWYKDTADSTDTSRWITGETDAALNASTITIRNYAKSLKKNSDYNKGYNQRLILTKESKQISIFIPLSRIFGFCADIDKIFRGAVHRIYFEKNVDTNILHSKAGQSYKFDILDMRWKLPKVIPSLASTATLEASLAKSISVPLMWESTNVYRSNAYTTSDTEISWRVLTTQHRPTHLFVVFQKAERVGNMTKNNVVFDHMKLERLSVRLNDTKNYPEDDLRCNFDATNLDYSSAYASLLSASIRGNGVRVDKGTSVSYLDFMKLYPIFHIDLTRRDASLYEVQRTTDILLNFKLSSAPDEGYYCYCVVISERQGVLNAIDRKLLVTL